MGKLSDFFSQTQADAASGASGGEAPPDLDRVRSELSQNRRRLSRADREATESRLASEFEKLYTPENWEALATFYPDVRYVVTGDECFIPTERERATSAVALATVARLLIKLDPGYVALIIFASTQAKMITRMEAQYRAKQRQKVKSIREPAQRMG